MKEIEGNDVGIILHRLARFAKKGPTEAKIAQLGFSFLILGVSASVGARMIEHIKGQRRRMEILCRWQQLKDPFFD